MKKICFLLGFFLLICSCNKDNPKGKDSLVGTIWQATSVKLQVYEDKVYTIIEDTNLKMIFTEKGQVIIQNGGMIDKGSYKMTGNTLSFDVPVREEKQIQVSLLGILVNKTAITYYQLQSGTSYDLLMDVSGTFERYFKLKNGEEGEPVYDGTMTIVFDKIQ